MDEKEIEAEVAAMNLFHVHLLLRAYILKEWGRPTAIITQRGKEMAEWMLNQDVYRETIDSIVAELKKGELIN